MKPTQEQVIAWAREAGGYTTEHYPDEWLLDIDDIKRFAALAYEAGRKDENEACAKVCENAYLSERTALFAASLIRERGQS